MDTKPLTGSMFSTSEGIFTTLINALLADGFLRSQDYRVQVACILGLAIATAAYALSRSHAKADSQ